MQSKPGASVRAGIFVIACGIVIIAGIIMLGQRSHVFERKYSLYAEFENARGLIPGADVYLAGVSAGSVRRVDVVSERGRPAIVQVTLDISEAHRPKIRVDSRASIRSIGALGDKYVEITPGAVAAEVLQPGERIPSEEPVDIYELGEEVRKTLGRANQIAEEVAETLAMVDKMSVINDMSDGIKTIRNLLKAAEDGPNLVHMLLYDPKLPKMLTDMQAAAKTLRGIVEDVDAGKGGLGVALRGKEFAKAVNGMTDISASAGAILGEIEKGDGLAHALIYDPKQREALADFGAAAKSTSDILDRVKNSEGTLGLLINDAGIWESLTRLLRGAEESRTLRFLIRRAARSNKDAPEPAKKAVIGS